MATTAVRGQKLANELARMADRLEGKFRKAFLQAMIAMADEPELKKLLKDIQAGRFTYGDSVDARLDAVRINLAEMNEVARQAIAGSAKVTKDVMNLKGSFDVVNDAVIDAAKNLSVELSTYLRKSTKESLRQIIEELISGDISEAEALRRIKLEVGLLPQHTKAVNNYRKTLINAGTPRGRANQLAEQYAKRLLKYRANMISRTEVARATGIGQTQFWRQMRDQKALPEQANRVWITALDERACSFCLSMNGQVASIDGGWETPDGYKEYPQASHPHCRCSSGIVMRRMTKTGREGAISKVEELEWEHWVSKHLSGKHDQRNHGRRKVATPVAVQQSRVLGMFGGYRDTVAKRIVSAANAEGIDLENLSAASMHPQGEDVWDSTEPSQLVRAMYEVKVDGYKTVVTEVHTMADEGTDYGSVMVLGNVVDSKGNIVGNFERTVNISAGGISDVDHNSFYINNSEQGSGIGAEFFNHSVASYDYLGAGYVTTHANIDVGGYAWAKAGFDFADSASRGTTASLVKDDLYVMSVDKQVASDIIFKRMIQGVPWSGGNSSRMVERQYERAMKKVADKLAKTWKSETLKDSYSKVEDNFMSVTPIELASLGISEAVKIQMPTVSRVGVNYKLEYTEISLWPGKVLMLGSDWNGVLALR